MMMMMVSNNESDLPIAKFGHSHAVHNRTFVHTVRTSACILPVKNGNFRRYHRRRVMVVGHCFFWTWRTCP